MGITYSIVIEASRDGYPETIFLVPHFIIKEYEDIFVALTKKGNVAYSRDWYGEKSRQILTPNDVYSVSVPFKDRNIYKEWRKYLLPKYRKQRVQDIGLRQYILHFAHHPNVIIKNKRIKNVYYLDSIRDYVWEDFKPQ